MMFTSDKNSDGKLSYEEFKEAMLGSEKSPQRVP